MQDARTEDNVVGSAQDVVTQKLAAVEANVDTAIQDVVHEMRSEAQDVVDQALNRLQATWERQRPKIEGYVAAHPWIVLGGLVLAGYLFAGRQRSRHR